MLDKFATGPWKIVLSVLLFPLLFEETFLYYAWGVGDIWWLALAKKVLILLPTLAIIFACWVTIACVLTVPFRHRRGQFLTALIVTWWDLGRSIASFWGGIIKFTFYLLGWLFNLVRIIVMGIWLLIQDIILSPFRMAKDVSSGAFRPGTPWIAAIMTIIWVILETAIFTYVLTSLVEDVLAGFVDVTPGSRGLQLILFLFLFFLVMGSYAVLEALGKAIKSRDYQRIAQNVILEIITMLFEVVFLYREFVDALVPWFAQHSGGDFSLGILGIIFIAMTVWFGIRSMTWFLFAGAGTPTLLAIIWRTGLQGQSHGGGDHGRGKGGDRGETLVFIHTAIDRLKKDIDWIHHKGDEMLGAFVLPPIQILAAAVNFCTLFLFANHLFELPFKSIKEVVDAKALLGRAKKANTADE